MSTETEHIKPMHILIRKGQDGRPEIADVFTSDWWDLLLPGNTIAVTEKSRKRTLKLNNGVNAYLKMLFLSQETFRDWRVWRYVFQLKHSLGDWQLLSGANHFIPWSWKFEAMNQAEFMQVRDAAEKEGIERGFPTYGTWVEAYHNERGDTSNTPRRRCSHPDCGNIAVHTHEIFPGTGRRQRCIELGLQVHLCYQHHTASHGKDPEVLAKQWCAAIGVDYEKALLLVNGDVKSYKLKSMVTQGEQL